MGTAARGKEIISINAPIGTKLSLEKLRKEVAEHEPRLKEECKDNGTFLAFMVKRFWQAHERAKDIDAKIEELNEKTAQLEERRAELEKTLDALRQEFIALLADFKKAGGTREDLLALLKLARASGLKPAELVCLMEIENVPGILAQLSRLEERVRQRIDETRKLERAIAAMQEVTAQLARKKEELDREVEARMRDLERANNAVALTCAVARDVGLYIDWIRDACEARGAMTVQEVALTPALVMAGAILEAAAQAYGDKEVTLMPGRKHPLPMQVSLREIARSLAPPEAYREQAKLERQKTVEA